MKKQEQIVLKIISVSFARRKVIGINIALESSKKKINTDLFNKKKDVVSYVQKQAIWLKIASKIGATLIN